MKRITHKLLSLPPYLSTSWKNVRLLRIKDPSTPDTLLVTLHNGSEIEVPQLDRDTIQEVFLAHSQFLEQELEEKKTQKTKEGKDPISFSMGMPFSFAFSGKEGAEAFTSFFQHNPEQSQLPNLPQEAIEKIRAMTKAMGLSLDHINAPKAEPHCNCMYCQIARAIDDNPTDSPLENAEEEVSPEDLTFKTWDITQASDKHYVVTNPLDETEHYQVYLGTPIGCTCGKKNCEHIRVVLSS